MDANFCRQEFFLLCDLRYGLSILSQPAVDVPQTQPVPLQFLAECVLAGNVRRRDLIHVPQIGMQDSSVQAPDASDIQAEESGLSHRLPKSAGVQQCLSCGSAAELVNLLVGKQDATILAAKAQPGGKLIDALLDRAGIYMLFLP